jgi:hypothetical protein
MEGTSGGINSDPLAGVGIVAGRNDGSQHFAHVLTVNWAIKPQVSLLIFH